MATANRPRSPVMHPAIAWLLFLVALVSYCAVIYFAVALDWPKGASTVLLMSPFVVLVAWALRAYREPVPLHFKNKTLSERIDNLVDMIRRAKREIVIVTGSLNHALYADPKVVEAMRGVSRKVSIRLIHARASLDPKSEPFIALLRDRTTPMRLQGDVEVRHAVVIDRNATKVEALGVPDDEPLKEADYYYDDYVVAEAVLREINGLDVAKSIFPSPPELTRS